MKYLSTILLLAIILTPYGFTHGVRLKKVKEIKTYIKSHERHGIVKASA